MDTVLKAIVTGVASIFFLASGFSVIQGVTGVVQASDYFECVSAVIAESGYNAAVIEECTRDAQDREYELEVKVYGQDVPGTQRYADIRMTYRFEISLLGYRSEKIRQKVL